jgi:predicted O-linked N-acetylglucosamine transferase (SPINDLY family)
MKTGGGNPFGKQIERFNQARFNQAPNPGPSAADLLLQTAILQHDAGRLAEAEAIYRQILSAAPNHAVALHLLGVIAHQVGQHAAAIELIDRAIQANPGYAEAYLSRANVRFAQGQHQQAVESYSKAIELKPDLPEAHHNRGSSLHLLEQYPAALEGYDKAIQLKPDYAEAYWNRGNTLFALERYEAALESFDKAIQLKPDYAQAHCGRGIALYVLHQYEAALESCDQAIELKPDFAEAYSNRANILYILQRHEEVVESCDRAIQINAEFPEALRTRGNALFAMQRYREARESYDRAIELKPLQAEAYNNRGSALHALGEYDASLDSYNRAVELKPDYAEAYNNRGNTLHGLRAYAGALEDYSKALELQPNYDYLAGMRVHMRRILCDWEGIEDEERRLEAAIERGERAGLPFALLAVSESAAVQRKAAEIYVCDKVPEQSSAASIARRPRRDRIRIGYFSADFQNHPISYLMAEVYERHDRSKFEVLGFSLGKDTGDEMRARVSGAIDRFMDVRSMRDTEVARLSRELEVDIAVDLTGFTRDGRPGIFAERVAPVQVNYLGYPGTMGASYIDYLIADPTLIPEASRQHYSEKIVYLPDTYQANDSQRAISEKPCARADEGLPETGFVFCCFNGAYKITPRVFDLWMRVLGRVEGSFLWLLEENHWATANLLKETERRGVDPGRIVFARSRPLAEHLARQRLADLLLDTLPYNAHTTASDALWAGLPVLTRMGETFAGRVAASLLRAIGLPELITTTEAGFEELAAELAHDPERLGALRQRLQENRLSTALFDNKAFTRHLEAAYSAMFERYQAGLAPEHIEIERIHF